jgi:drug/metabolite transporter (DMT)-like permease
MSHRNAYILLSLVALLWAGNFPASKIGLTELGPVTLTAVRAVLVTPVLVLLARLLHGPVPTLRRSDYTTFVVLSLTGLVGNTTIWFWGMQYTSPINAGILGAAAPAVVAVAGALWLGDRLSRANMTGIALTVAAVLLTISHGSAQTLRTLSFNRGDLLILTSEIGWVTYTLYSRATKTQLAPVTIMAGAHVVSSALLLPLALAVEGWAQLAHAGWAGWGVVLYGAFPVTLGHLWFYQSIRTVGAGRAAVFTNLIPFLVIGLSWAILGEPIRWYHSVGATVVLAGVILTTRRYTRRGA